MYIRIRKYVGFLSILNLIVLEVNCSDDSNVISFSSNDSADIQQILENKFIESWDPKYYCVEGFKLNEKKDKCILEDSVIPTLACPEGWSMEKDNCITTALIPASYSCPKSFESLNDHYCYKLVEAPIQLECQNNYKLDNSLCSKIIYTKPNAFCVQGLLEGTKCIDIQNFEFTYTCPNNFKLSKDYCLHENSFESISRCPLNYIFIENKCVKETLSEPEYFCDQNSELKRGMCESLVKVPFELGCPQNFVKSGDNCKRIVENNPKFVCPPYSEEIDANCYLTKKIKPTKTCLDVGKNIKPCSSIVPSTIDCPPGYSLIGKNDCIKKSVIEKIPFCPINSSFEKHKCLSNEFTELVKICPDQFKSDNDKFCLGFEYSQPLIKCKHNSNFDKTRNLCVSKIMRKAEKICDRGYLDTESSKCVIKKIVSATKKCLGANVDAHAEICSKIVETEPLFSCPPDFEHIGDSCIGKILSDPTISCDSPFTFKNNKCIYKEIVLKKLFCQHGIIAKGGCIVEKREPRLLVCPEEYKFDSFGKICKKNLYSAPIRKCGDGNYDAKVKKCYRFVDKNKVPLPKPINDSNNLTNPRESLLPLNFPNPLNINQPLDRSTTSTTTLPPTTRKTTITLIENHDGKREFVASEKYVGEDALKKIQLIKKNRNGGDIRHVNYIHN